MFDSAGSLVRALGREGAGPAEFRRMNGIRVDARDNIYLYDPRQQRLLIFDSAGVAVSTLGVGGYSFGGHWDGGIDQQGRLVDQQVRSSPAVETFVRRRDLKSDAEEWFPYGRCKVDSPVIEHPYGMLGVPYGAEELQ